MDGCDFYDYFVGPLQALAPTDLAKVADVALADNWFMTQQGPDHVADLVADAIYTQYVDTGAADDVGPGTFFNAYVNGILA